MNPAPRLIPLLCLALAASWPAQARTPPPPSFQNDLPVVKLAPQVRIQAITPPTPRLPIDALRPLFSRSQVADPDSIRRLPFVASLGDGRTQAYAPGDALYVRGLNGGDPRRYGLYRVGGSYADPDSGEPLGMELDYLGDANLAKLGHGQTPSTLTITQARAGVPAGAVLLASNDRENARTLTPKPAPENLDARILKLHGALNHGAQYRTATVDRGHDDGLRSGHVFALLGRDRSGQEKAADVLSSPGEAIGSLFIYRTFARVSYGLILTSRRPIRIGDIAASPTRTH